MYVNIIGQVDVKPAKPRGNERNQKQTIHSEEQSNGTSTSNKKIFVGGLPLDLTEEEFKSYFGSFVTIIDAVVIHDKETHRTRGFGFVIFDSEDVENNLLQKSLYELKNKLVEVKRAEPKDMNHSQIFSYHWNNTVLSSGSLGYVLNAPYYHHYAPYFDFYSPICASSYGDASWNYFGTPFYGGATWLHPYGYEVPTFEPNGVDFGAFPILNIGTWNGFQPNGDMVPYANLAPHDNGNLPQP